MAAENKTVLVMFQVGIIYSHPDTVKKLIRKLDKNVDTSQLDFVGYPQFNPLTYTVICSEQTAKKFLKLSDKSPIKNCEVEQSGSWMCNKVIERRGNKPQVFIN